MANSATGPPDESAGSPGPATGAPDDGGSGEEQRIEARRLADELRRVIERLAVVDAPADELARAADAARSFADRLESLLPGDGGGHGSFAETSVAGTPKAHFDRSPLIGAANPLAAPVQLQVVEEEGAKPYVEGRAVFNAAYEGPPASVHGGLVAAAFDEVLGYAQSLSGRVGMTGTLTVRYRSPTPLYAELRFHAWVERVDGRKIFVTGTCHAGDRLTAEAEAVFIAVDFERIARIMRQGREGSS